MPRMPNHKVMRLWKQENKESLNSQEAKLRFASLASIADYAVVAEALQNTFNGEVALSFLL
jgi:hypothetical protein